MKLVQASRIRVFPVWSGAFAMPDVPADEVLAAYQARRKTLATLVNVWDDEAVGHRFYVFVTGEKV